MDLTKFREKTAGAIKKYRYAILVLIIGIGLMLIPNGSNRSKSEQTAPSESLQADETEALTQILSQVKGAGKVKVLLTLASGERIIYQTDDDAQRKDTVIVTNSDRAQQGLVEKVLAPEYRGAVVVCQGADDVSVRLAIVEAVSCATGLGTDKITVLKMK
ncbi:MAG: hypothetical protein IJV82_01095 [Oscillospiraceae bacterium]|nr:hypothetical protein [Oscillospiraceae bacterium]